MWLQRPECRAAVHPDEPEAGGGDAAPTERAGRARRPRPHTARPASVSLIYGIVFWAHNRTKTYSEMSIE